MRRTRDNLRRLVGAVLLGGQGTGRLAGRLPIRLVRRTCSWVTGMSPEAKADTIQTLLVYPGEVQVYFEGTFCNARNGAMMELMGSEATLYIDRGRFELIPEARRTW